MKTADSRVRPVAPARVKALQATDIAVHRICAVKFASAPMMPRYVPRQNVEDRPERLRASKVLPVTRGSPRQ